MLDCKIKLLGATGVCDYGCSSDHNILQLLIAATRSHAGRCSVIHVAIPIKFILVQEFASISSVADSVPIKNH